MNKYSSHEDVPGNPSVAKTSEVKLRTHAENNSLRVLTMDQWNFWIDNGYVVIKNAISKDQAMKTAEFIWEFDDKIPNDPETWYSKARAEMEMKTLRRAAPLSQCPRTDLNKRSLPRPTTTPA